MSCGNDNFLMQNKPDTLNCIKEKAQKWRQLYIQNNLVNETLNMKSFYILWYFWAW